MDNSMDEQDLYAALLHEVKNDMALVAMAMDRIPRTGEPEHDGALDEARLLGQRLSDRLVQALFLYRGERGGMALNTIDAYCPADLVGEIAAQARSLAGRLEVKVEYGPDLPAFWFYDRNMLEMALVNALHNALKYARERIVIRAEVRDGMFTVALSDDSDGYPEHILSAAAEGRFLQSGGTGLGLRFSKLIAEAHRNEGRTGRLRLYNDHGAVFEISVP